LELSDYNAVTEVQFLASEQVAPPPLPLSYLEVGAQGPQSGLSVAVGDERERGHRMSSLGNARILHLMQRRVVAACRVDVAVMVLERGDRVGFW
jgi:hypothetical protein